MKEIIWIAITDKDICDYMAIQMKYWEPVAYGGKHYMMTFEYNVYEVIV